MSHTHLAEFPRIVSTSFIDCRAPKELKGYISIQGTDFFIHLVVPNFPSIKNMTAEYDVGLKEIFHHCKFEDEELNEDEYIADYLERIQRICSSYLENAAMFDGNKLQEHNQLMSLEDLLLHIEELGWKKIKNISQDFLSIILQTIDSRERVHELHLQLSLNYPDETPTVTADLPLPFQFSWKAEDNLRDIFKIWTELLDNLCLFWDVLDAIDEVALVLDPAEPARKHQSRRIVLENHVNVHLTFSPLHPAAFPKCQLLGPSSIISPLNDKIAEDYQSWDPCEDPVRNLERILGIPVIRKSHRSTSSAALHTFSQMLPDQEDEAYDFDCAVCYCLHLDEQLPDLSCDHCKKKFHLSCLYEWLVSNPSSRHSLQLISGDCPYCTKTISCSRSINT